MKPSVLSLLAMTVRNMENHNVKLPVLRGVVFDMDGTLTKPNLDFDAMYRRCGVDRSQDILEEIQTMTPDRRAKAESIIEEMEEEGRRTLELMPGALQLIQWLSAHKVPMALVTRNTLTSANVLMDRLLPQDCTFEKIIARDNADDLPPKPNPQSLLSIAEEWQISLPSENILMIGDSLSNDIGFGKNAGVATALLDTDGTYDVDRVDDNNPQSKDSINPDMVINHLATMPSHLWSQFFIESPLGTAKNNLHGQPEPTPTTEFTKAAAEGDLSQINAILDGDNIDVNETDESGNTALIWAVDRGHQEVAERILQVAGVDLNCRGYLGANAVTRAARRGYNSILDIMAGAGAELDTPNQKLQYPLHFAAFKQHPATVELLLERGANPWVLDRKGRTPADDTTCEVIRDKLVRAMNA